MMRTTWGDHNRFIETYFTMYPNIYFTGDGCRLDEDGDYWLMGRIDDVVNVSGHRIGTAEVESALVSHPKVAEAAVAPMPHDIKGQGLYAFVTLKDGVAESDELKKELANHVRKEIGPIAVPDKIQFAPGPAEDAFGQNHAPHPAQDRRERRGPDWRHHHAGRPARRRGAGEGKTVSQTGSPGPDGSGGSPPQKDEMKPRTRLTPFAEAIARKGASPDRLAERVAGDPGLLPEVLEGLGADEPRIKYGCSKVLRLVSQNHPAVLYPRFDFFAGLLDADNNFLKWDAARVVANLSAVDAEGKLEPILTRYLRPIRGPAMITAATVIQNAATIALSRPALAGRLGRAVLKVEQAEYQTAECRNVAIGHAIESLGRFFHLLDAKEKSAVVKFVRRQLTNRRNAVRKKAAAFLKRREGESPGKSA